jgi:hypothetical protein
MHWKGIATVGLIVAAFAWSSNIAGPASANAFPANPGQLPNSADKLNWVNYTDTAEGAFSMDVPVGWQVQGGMYRFGYFDVRWMMDARSLDGKIILRVSDANVPPYALPGPHTGREGQPFFKPQQFQMMVSSYRDGQGYAAMYAKHRFASVCKTMNPRQPDWTPNLPPEMKDDLGTKSTDGSVFYDCDTSDGPRIAGVFVHSTLNPNGGFWVVLPVSFLAAPARAADAHAMVQHMLDSWRKNPQWVQYQQQITQAGLERVRENFGQFMKQMQAYHQARTAAMNQQVAGFEAHQNAQARQVSSWGETLTGLETVSDPSTGTQFQVFTGPKANQYINGNGVIVNSNLSPGPEFHQLTTVQH